MAGPAGGVTASSAPAKRKAGSAGGRKAVGQLRFAVVDAFLPLIAGLGAATALGLPARAGWVAFAAGGVPALWRMRHYLGR